MSDNGNNNTVSMTELDMCKTALCFKEHELFALRSDVQTQHAILQTLSQSIERLERTLSAGMDRLARTMNRQGKRDPSPNNSYTDNNNNNKRRRLRETR
jgi:hypothetical protein